MKKERQMKKKNFKDKLENRNLSEAKKQKEMLEKAEK